VRITIAQLNPVIGDVEGNLAMVRQVLPQARQEQADLVVFPELFLAGYPPRDLLERPWFIRRVQQALEDLRGLSLSCPETGILIGAPLPTGQQTGRGLHNAALLIYQGATRVAQHKSLLPTYDVFDEARYFDPCAELRVTAFKNEVLGVSICEDAWNDPELWPERRYDANPVQALARQGASLLINIAASPFYAGKDEVRLRILQQHSRRYGLPFVMANQVGGNDELIFDGGSLCVDRHGDPVELLDSFCEQVRTVDTARPGRPGAYVPRDIIASVHDGLVLGLRDYLRKCGFGKAVLGLSGGIDSAVVCCLAARALGPENVLGISMPSPYSSPGSIEDARSLAANLGIDFRIIPIASVYASYLETLKEHFAGRPADLAEENIQARIRGNILMGLSNKFGHLLLTTGNKSELAVGYCTLYGDMAGGLAVISDVPKTMVYQLAAYINRARPVIPQASIDKAPSAELRPNQKDQDTLPPYEMLDRILHYYVDERWGLQEIVAAGFDQETVAWVIRAIDRSEYKRKQAPPGLKVTTKAFGMGRRMAIAAKYEP